ncbi:MAG TPA: hypothetical protein VGO93_29200 [Candidatus Xenobia bacterium]|jgi:hypothetical protein
MADGVALALLALAVRLPVIFLPNYSADEAFSFYMSRLNIPDLLQGLISDRHPPLDYFLLHLIHADAEWAMRLPSVLFDVISTLMVWRITLKLGGSRRAGWLAGAGYALLYSTWALDTQARMFPLAQCLQLVGTDTLIDILVLNQRTVGRYALYVVSMVAAVGTLYFSALIAIGQGFAAILLDRRKTGAWWAAILIGILSLPMARFMLLQMRAGNKEEFAAVGFWLHVCNVYPYITGLTEFLEAATRIDLADLLAQTPLLLFSATITLALAFWQGSTLYRMKPPARVILGAIFLTYCGILLTADLATHGFNLRDRYYFPMQPYMAVLAGVALGRDTRGAIVAGLVGLANVIILIAVLNIPFLWLFDFKTVTAAIQARPGDMVLLDMPSNYYCLFEYYDARQASPLVRYQGDIYLAEPTPNQYFFRTPEALAGDLPKLVKHPHVWFVTNRLGGATEDVRRLLAEHFVARPVLDDRHSYGLLGIDHTWVFDMVPRP